MIRVRFACGHGLSADDLGAVPLCPTCGERRVSHVDAPPPRFRGFVTGPLATFDAAVAPHAARLQQEQQS